jgi:hypothetical protein
VATEFHYSISTSFPNHTVNLAVLTAQIKTLPGGPTLLDHIDVAGDDLAVFTTTDLSGPQVTALAAIIVAHTGAGFTSGVQRLFSEAEQTSTATAFVTAATLTSGLLAAGDYTINWYCELSVATQDNTSLCVGSLSWDGTERASGANPLAFYVPASGAVTVTVADLTAPVFTVQFRRVGTANTARVRRIRLSIVPVPANITEN